MWIKELYATFGSLDNRRLSLKQGLNIVYGRNEAGKSTWSAFIRAMLYGISTREKAKAGYIPDKERYLPWNGNPMYGKAELVSDGDEITIERTSGKSGVFSKVEAKNITRGGEAPTGEELCGIAKGVYDRCAFIGQAKLGIDRDADTEKKILSLASSGEETVSAQEVLSRLEKKQREIRSPRGLGALPELEREIAVFETEIETAAETEVSLARTEESLSLYAQKEARIERAIKIAEAMEQKKVRKLIRESAAELARAEAVAAECETLPLARDVDVFSEMRDTCRKLELSVRDVRTRLSEAERGRENAERETEASVFAGMSGNTAAEKAKKDKEDLLFCTKKKTLIPGIILIVFAAAAANAGIVLFYLKMMRLAAACALFAVLCGAAGAVLFTGSGKKKRLLKAVAADYGAADVKTIETALEAYLGALERKKEAEENSVAAKAELSAAEQSILLREADLRAYLVRFGIDETDISEGEAKLRADAQQRERAFLAVREAQIRAEAIKSSAPAETEQIEYEEVEIPSESMEELRIQAHETASVRKSLELECAALRERLSGFDITRANEQLSALKERESELSFNFDAYSLAAKYVGEADAEMRSRFSPEVEKRTSEIFASLTGGSFEVVRIRNSDFDMDVATGVAGARRDGLMLSRGTLDELYFSLRLALCELILPAENAPPIVLDDVFVNFDDERTQRALNLLRETAKTRQIILFSCHTREAGFFENDDKVNTVNL